MLFELDTNWNPGVGPTGAVSLTENNQVLGSTTNLLMSKGNLTEDVTGSITIQASQFPVGLNTVTMAYSGDSNYAPATATLTVENTGQPAFTLSNSGTLQLNAGATSGNSMAISLTPTNGFTGTVNLSCVVNTNLTNPTGPPGCALSPAALNITGKPWSPALSPCPLRRRPASLAGVIPYRRTDGSPGPAVLVWYPKEAHCMAADGDRHRSSRFDRCSRLWQWRRRVSKQAGRQPRNNSRELLRYRDRDRCRNRKDHSPDDSERYC